MNTFLAFAGIKFAKARKLVITRDRKGSFGVPQDDRHRMIFKKQTPKGLLFFSTEGGNRTLMSRPTRF